MRNARISLGTPKVKRPLESQGVEGRIILRQILEKQDVK
jgi:hypothetical protein